METAPQKEHAWLQRIVGEWTCETDATVEPGKLPEKMQSTEHVRSVGGLWIIGIRSSGRAKTTGCSRRACSATMAGGTSS